MKGCTVERIKISSAGRDIRLLLLRPTLSRLAAEDTPALLWLHGGGYATGMPEMAFFTRALALVKKYGAVVAVPDYRLSPEAPYPAALEDCYAALEWLHANARRLGANPAKLMVGGESAGGGLTAALCIYARDRGGPAISFQFPLYPMLDERDTPSSRDNHAPVWNTRCNHAAWKMYLRGIEAVPAYAAPARCGDYSGLPPAYTFVGDIEPFLCETLNYVEALRAAGVEANVDVYPDWFHAYDIFFPFTKKARTAIDRFEEAYLAASRRSTKESRE